VDVADDLEPVEPELAHAAVALVLADPGDADGGRVPDDAAVERLEHLRELAGPDGVRRDRLRVEGVPAALDGGKVPSLVVHQG